MIGNRGRAGARRRILDEQSRASVPVHGLFGIHPQLFAHALDQDVLLGGNAGAVDIAIRRSELSRRKQSATFPGRLRVAHSYSRVTHKKR